jgi:hypothetical protein
MDHEQIDRFDLIDRYLMGKLVAEDSASFEEHFVDCPRCIAQLQTTKSFLRDMRLEATEQASQIDRSQPTRGFRQYLQTFFPKPVALAASCLLIAAIAGAIFVFDYTRRMRTEVNQAESLSEQWQRRYEDERQAAISAEEKQQETELQRTEQLRALEAKLKDEVAQRTKLEAELSRGMQPDGNLLIFSLISPRGQELNTSEAVNKITLPRSSAMFAFSISLEGETGFTNYRITIFDDQRRLIWKSGRLTPDAQNSLSIILKPSSFRPGHYSLKVEGVKKAGGADVVGNYPFQIIKTA